MATPPEERCIECGTPTRIYVWGPDEDTGNWIPAPPGHLERDTCACCRLLQGLQGAEEITSAPGRSLPPPVNLQHDQQGWRENICEQERRAWRALRGAFRFGFTTLEDERGKRRSGWVPTTTQQDRESGSLKQARKRDCEACVDCQPEPHHIIRNAVLRRRLLGQIAQRRGRVGGRGVQSAQEDEAG